jgi:hypothetical protein
MIIKLLIIATLFTSFTAFGQGRKVAGLNVGFWTENFEDASRNYILKGNYKIIPLAQYNILRKLGGNCFEVRHKGSTPLVFYSGISNGNISVKDGIWNNYDQTGNLREVDFWKEGLNQWTRYYDEKGYLIRYNWEDYENDTSFQYTFISGQLFKKAFYPPENKNRQTEIYYPNDPLIISDAELDFTINFIDKPSAIREITIAAEEDLVINSISQKRKFVKITSSDNQPIIFPLHIKANTSIPLKISVTPTSANYEMTDTISILTAESKVPYIIYSNIYAHHVNGQTVETLASIQLSRTKDKFLVLPSMGTVTDATIVSNNGDKSFYKISGTTKIDLSTFPIGVYQLQISSCHTGGRMKFVIIE